MKPVSLAQTQISAIKSNFVPKSLRHIQGKNHCGGPQQNPNLCE